MKTIKEIRCENLIGLVDEVAGGNQAKLSRLLELNPTIINNIISPKQKNRNMGDDLARKIESTLGKPEGWMDQIHTCTQNKFVHIQSFNHDSEADNDHDFVTVRQFRDVSMAAGAGSHNGDTQADSSMSFKKSWMKYKGYNPEKCCVVYVKGDSMSPSINDGAVILVNMDDREIVDGKLYALNYSGDARVKMLSKTAIGGILIQSFNPSCKDEILKPDEVQYLNIIGRVVWSGNEW